MRARDLTARISLTGFLAAILLLSCASKPACPSGAPSTAACGACPVGATKQGAACVCADGHAPWLGACVSASVETRACGPGERLTAGVCVKTPCASDAVFDEAADSCVGIATVRSVVGVTTFNLDDGDRIGCPRGATIHVAHGRARCEAGGVCARGQLLDAKSACFSPSPCNAGAIPFGEKGACEPFVDHEGRVDAAKWLRLAVGADGAAGTRWACAPLDAMSDRVVDAPDVPFAVTIQLDVPANDVTQAILRAKAKGVGDSSSLLNRAFEPIADAFRALGGTSTTPQTAVEITCSVAAAPRPIRVREGDDGGIPAQNPEKRANGNAKKPAADSDLSSPF